MKVCEVLSLYWNYKWHNFDTDRKVWPSDLHDDRSPLSYIPSQCLCALSKNAQILFWWDWHGLHVSLSQSALAQATNARPCPSFPSVRTCQVQAQNERIFVKLQIRDFCYVTMFQFLLKFDKKNKALCTKIWVCLQSLAMIYLRHWERRCCLCGSSEAEEIVSAIDSMYTLCVTNWGRRNNWVLRIIDCK